MLWRQSRNSTGFGVRHANLLDDHHHHRHHWIKNLFRSLIIYLKMLRQLADENKNRTEPKNKGDFSVLVSNKHRRAFFAMQLKSRQGTLARISGFWSSVKIDKTMSWLRKPSSRLTMPELRLVCTWRQLALLGVSIPTAQPDSSWVSALKKTPFHRNDKKYLAENSNTQLTGFQLGSISVARVLALLQGQGSKITLTLLLNF